MADQCYLPRHSSVPEGELPLHFSNFSQPPHSHRRQLVSSIFQARRPVFPAHGIWVPHTAVLYYCGACQAPLARRQRERKAWPDAEVYAQRVGVSSTGSSACRLFRRSCHGQRNIPATRIRASRFAITVLLLPKLKKPVKAGYSTTRKRLAQRGFKLSWAKSSKYIDCIQPVFDAA